MRSTSRPILLFGLLVFSGSSVLAASASGCGSESRHRPSGDTSGGGGGGGSASSSSASSSGTGGSGGAGGSGPIAAFHLSGTLTYDSVPYDVQLDGLDYGFTQKRPIRGVSLSLLDADTGAEVAKTVTNDKGGYTFAYDGPAHVKLWIYSETAAPVITVEDNTASDAVYVLESEVADSAAQATLDVLAASGWGGKSYTGPRASAPFAVLDAAYEAARRFIDEVSPPPVFPPLKINWSINNRPEDGDLASGQIGTSFWDDEELYILGKADVDTDEFDSHVIVHEWGHSFETRIGRSDSFGGGHGYGDVLDPRVAMGEGFCNALSAIILDPDSVYTDSSGLGQADGFSDDIEVNDSSAAASPGWFSEQTVQNVVYDLYDSGAGEPFDTTAVGLKGIYDAMVGGQKTTQALTTLFSFVKAVKSNGGDVAAIDALVAHHTLNADFGISTVQDDWATGETHDAGMAPSLPLYKKVSIGASATASLVGGGGYNALAQNRFFQIAGDGQPVTVTTTCPSDVDIYVYHVGQIVAQAETLDGNEAVTFDTVSGQTYVLNVEGYNNAAVSYSAQVNVFH